MKQDAVPDAPAAVLPSTCTLYQDDCMAVMPKLKTESIGMAFADLPYGVSKKAAWDAKIDLDTLWKNLKKVAKQNSVFVFTCNLNLLGELINSQKPLFRYEIIWQKSIPSNFMMGKKRPLLYHEYIAVFAKKSHLYIPQMRDRPESSRRHNRDRVTSSKPHSSLHLNYKKETRLYDYSRQIYPGSILQDMNEATRKLAMHPTQKPVALIEWLIKTYTNPGDTVLDPVFGSCTTGVACARLGRSFIGIEKDPEYFRIGRERVDAERAKLGLQPCETKTWPKTSSEAFSNVTLRDKVT